MLSRRVCVYVCKNNGESNGMEKTEKRGRGREMRMRRKGEKEKRERAVARHARGTVCTTCGTAHSTAPCSDGRGDGRGACGAYGWRCPCTSFVCRTVTVTFAHSHTCTAHSSASAASTAQSPFGMTIFFCCGFFPFAAPSPPLYSGAMRRRPACVMP